MDAARNHYEGSRGRSYHGDKRGLPPEALAWVRRARARRLQPDVPADASLFEFGCGAGWNLADLRCRRRVGMDASVFLRAEVEAVGAEFVEDSADFPAGSFDIALAHHSLEHVADPAAVLVELRRLLRPVGRLLVVVPYEYGRAGRSFRPDEPNRHLFAWTPQTLGMLATVCGFTVTRVGLRRYGYDRFAARLAVRLGRGETTFRILRRAGQLLFPLREVALLAQPGPVS